MDEVEIVTLTEADLFRLSEYVDDLVETSQRFRDDGVLLRATAFVGSKFRALATVFHSLDHSPRNTVAKTLNFDSTNTFNLADDSGSGTSLEDFLMKNGEGLEDSLKRLNPIHVPQNKDFYGHMAFTSSALDQDEVKSSVAALLQQPEYLVSSNNCCMSAMNENGVAGLLRHYFEEEIPAHASYPPQFYRPESLSKLAQKAATKSRTFNSTKRKLDSMTSIADKAAELSRLLDRPKQRKEEEASLSSCCACWICVSSDEVLVEEEDGLMKPSLQETANFYRGKGFMYASGVNVTGGKRNRVTTNFSLSFLNHLTFTSLLEGFFPGINSPFLYFGFLHSFFPIHVEDLSLWSINFVHHGFPKLWIVVPPSSVAKLQYFLSREFTCSEHGSCVGLLGHKYHLPTPSWLNKNGIPFKVVVQQSGQGIIVAPNAAHMGFNLGQNVSEATNFASKYWIPFGIVYPKCACMLGQVHADLSTIISSFSPDMLQAYLHRKIPTTKFQAQFVKSIVFPHLWKEAFESAGVENQQQSSDEEGSNTESTVSSNAALVPVTPKHLKRKPNRKNISCPACGTSYAGGQKKRLLRHFTVEHSDLPDEEKQKAEGLLHSMFPDWGAKLPKKTCEYCGKSVARSLKAHQKSSACVLPGQT